MGSEYRRRLRLLLIASAWLVGTVVTVAAQSLAVPPPPCFDSGQSGRLFPPACVVQTTPPMPWPPPPPPPPPPFDPAVARSFDMQFKDMGVRWFTAEELGHPLDQTSDTAYCEGRLVAGSYRYYTDGKAPSSTTGVLVPMGVNIPPTEDVNGTLEHDGETVILFDRTLVLGFKAVPATGNGATITWTCQT